MLLLNVFIEQPSDSLAVGATLDGAPITLAKAYNSRGLVRSRCFLGFYYDASSLLSARGDAHELVLQLPKLPAGAFKGAFWNNVETEVETAAGALASPPACTVV